MRINLSCGIAVRQDVVAHDGENAGWPVRIQGIFVCPHPIRVAVVLLCKVEKRKQTG